MNQNLKSQKEIVATISMFNNFAASVLVMPISCVLFEPILFAVSMQARICCSSTSMAHKLCAKQKESRDIFAKCMQKRWEIFRSMQNIAKCSHKCALRSTYHGSVIFRFQDISKFKRSYEIHKWVLPQNTTFALPFLERCRRFLSSEERTEYLKFNSILQSIVCMWVCAEIEWVLAKTVILFISHRHINVDTWPETTQARYPCN